jgi:type II secretory pathway pseudopilin PulG
MMIRSLENALPRCRYRGYTVIEVTLVAGLMSLLVLMISGVWSGLGRSTTDATARCRVAQEANLAMESLVRDLGGSLPDQITGEKQQGRLVGRLIAGGPQLQLCFDGDDDGQADWGSPDTVIIYEVLSNRLVRRDVQAASEFTVAGNVDQMQLTDQGDGVGIDLTFTYREITRTYTIVAKDP